MMLTPEQLEYLRGMRFEESCGGLSVGSDAIVAHIDAQQARIAELAQDAARYRWCKDNPDNAASVFDNLGPAYFDSEIDMLMQK